MKIRWIGIVLSVFFLIGITIFTRILIQHEQKNKTQDIQAEFISSQAVNLLVYFGKMSRF